MSRRAPKMNVDLLKKSAYWLHTAYIQPSLSTPYSENIAKVASYPLHRQVSPHRHRLRNQLRHHRRRRHRLLLMQE